jgi:3-hydroxybutyryl-CoA dehydratase
MANPVRSRAVKGLLPGDTFCFSRRFSQKETSEFGDLTRDYNPVHYDTRWTRIKGFKNLICHGLLVGGMICEFGGQVGWLATGMTFKFLYPVYFGDTIQCKVTLTRIQENGRAEASAQFTNQSGRKVALATLTGRLPNKEEKALLQQMVSEGDPANRISDKTDYLINQDPDGSQEI